MREGAEHHHCPRQRDQGLEMDCFARTTVKPSARPPPYGARKAFVASQRPKGGARTHGTDPPASTCQRDPSGGPAPRSRVPSPFAEPQLHQQQQQPRPGGTQPREPPESFRSGPWPPGSFPDRPLRGACPSSSNRSARPVYRSAMNSGH